MVRRLLLLLTHPVFFDIKLVFKQIITAKVIHLCSEL